MLNIKFRQEGGPAMDVFVVKKTYDSMVTSALTTSGYILEIAEVENPWQAVAVSTLDRVDSKSGDGMMLLVSPQQFGPERPVEMVLKAISIYSPQVANDTWRTMHRPVHHETQDR
jgi:hypothetical protein